MRSRSLRPIGLVAICLIALAGHACSGVGTSSPAVFGVSFLWPDGKTPTFNPALYMFARVEERDVDATTVGTVLTVALNEPVAYDGKTTAGLTFGNVPDGHNRVVVVELHQGDQSTSQVVYYGASKQFSLEPGTNINVQVALQLQAAPGVVTMNGSPPAAAIAVVPTGAAGYVNQPLVQLQLTTDTGTSVRLANELSAVTDATAQSLAGLPSTGTTVKTFTLAGWDLNDGLTDVDISACPVATQLQGCARTVYASFLDSNGYPSPVVSAQVILDQVAPGLINPSADPPFAKVLDTIVFSLEPNEPLSATPTSAVTQEGMLSSLTLDYATNTKYIFTHSVVEDEMPNGAFAATFSLTDLAGNTADSAPEGGIPFDIESVIPKIAGLKVTGSRFSAVSPFNTVPIQFNVAKSVDSPAGTLTVTVDNLPVTNCSPYSATQPNYTCSFTVPMSESSNTKLVSVTATDIAGNTDTQTTSVVFDLDAPTVASGQAAPPIIGLGQTTTLLVTANKTLTGMPMINVLPPGSLTVGSPTITGSNSFAVTVSAPTSDPLGAASGAYTSAVTMTDDVGNVAMAVAGPNFAVDTKVPQITNVSATNAHAGTGFSRNVGFNSINIGFTVSKQVTLTGVTIGAIVVPSSQCTPPSGNPATGGRWSCLYPVTGQEPEGVQSLTISVTDSASNAETSGTSVTFDFTPPSLLSSGAAPPIVGLGGTESLTFTASEALGVTPAPAVTGPRPLNWIVTPSGNSYTYAAPLPASDSGGAYSGVYASTITLTDLVGNTTTAPIIGPSFTAVTLQPTFSGMQIANAAGQPATRFSARAGFNQIVLRVNWNGWNGTNPASITASLGSLAFPNGCAEVGVTSVYSCGYTVTGAEAEGNETIKVSATDEAGNAASVSAAITLDFTPPALLAKNAVPAIVGLGQTEAISFTPTEALGAAPFLSVSGKKDLNWSQPSIAGTTYTYVATIPSSDPSNAYSGSYTSTVALVDLVGNSAAAPLTGPAFAVDTQSPVVIGLQTQNAAMQPANRFSTRPTFNSIGIVFGVSKAVTTVAVAVGQNAVPGCAPTAPGALTYSCTYAVTGSEPETSVPVVVNVIDAAGNSAQGQTTVTFDFTSPTLLSQGASPAIVGLGQTETIVLSPSEALANPPSLSINPSSVAFTAPVTSGASFIYTSAIGVGASSQITGAYTSTVGMTDLVGNPATLMGPSFQIDTLAPTISNLQTFDGTGEPATRFSAKPNFNTLVVTFDWSSWQAALPSAVTATLGTIPINCTPQNPWGAPFEFTCIHNVTLADPEQSLQVSVQATDQGGNTTSAQTTVTLDFTAPSILASSATPLIAGLGQTETLSITPSETLGVPPVFAAQGPATLNFTTGVSGSQYQFSTPIPASDPTNAYSGSYTTTAELTDTVGNFQTDQGPPFQIDTVAPTIGPLTTNGSTFSAKAMFNQIQLTFDTPKSLDGTGNSLTATVAGIAMHCGTYQAQSPRYTCTYPVTGTEPEGPQPINVNALDEAGNTSNAFTTITFDFTAPTLLVSSPTPANVGLGEQEVLALNPSEALNGPPQVTVSGPGGMLTFTLVANTTYSFADILSNASPSAEGTYTSTVLLTDMVANSQTVAGPSFFYDPVVPAISNLKTNANLFSAKPMFSTVTATFDTPKSLDGISGGLTVTVGSAGMTCGTYQSTSPAYTCNYTVTGSETEGSQTLTVKTIDESSNATTRTTTVTFDFTAPSLLNTLAAPATYGIGKTVAYTLQPSEALAMGYPAIQGSGTALGFSQNVLTYSHTVAPTDPSGSYSLQWVLQDLVGNTSDPLPTTAASFTIDTAIPTLAITAGNNTTYSQNMTFNVVTISATTGDATDVVTATLGTKPMTCTTANLPAWNCTYTVTSTDTEGPQVVAVTATSPSGNTLSLPATVIFDFTPPSLQAKKALPPIVGLGQTEALLLTPSESLSAAPTLVVSDPNGNAVPFNLENGTEYTFTGTLNSSNVNGNYGSAVTMTDLVGNSDTVAGPTFAADVQPPTVTNLAVHGGYQNSRFSAQPSFSAMTITLDTGKSVDTPGSALVVTVAGFPATMCGTYQTTSPNYTCTYNVTGMESEGTASVLAQAADEAGNVSGESTNVTLDFTAPTLLSSPPSVGTVGIGQSVVFVLNVSEPNAAGFPAIQVSPTPIAFNQSADGLTFSHRVRVGDPSVTDSAAWVLQDVVGNQSAPLPGAMPTFTIDTSVPTVQIQSGSGATYSYNFGYRDVVLTAVSDDGTATIAATLSGNPMTCTPGMPTNGATCTYRVTPLDQEGPQFVQVSATRPSGNVATTSTTVTFDFTPPSLLDIPASPGLVGVGQPVTLSLDVSEQNGVGYPLAQGTGTLLGFTATGLTYSHVVTTVDASGPYQLQWILQDLVGNTSSPLPEPPVSFTVDSTFPTISIPSGQPQVYSRVIGFNAVNLIAITDDALSTVTATLADNSMSCSVGGDSVTWSCTYPVTMADTEGPHVVVATAKRASGNASSASTSIAFDFTPPVLVNSLTAPAAVGLGQIVAFTLQPNEASAPGYPQIQVTGPGSLAFMQNGLTFSHPVTASDMSGGYSIQWLLSDAVGNVSQPLPVPPVAFTIDTIIPAISNVQVLGGSGTPPTTFSDILGYNAATLTFDTAESVTGGSLSASIAGVDAFSCGTYSPSPPNYTCALMLPGLLGSGQYPISIVVVDVAGNSATNADAPATIVLDYQALTISAFVSPTSAPAGSTPTLTVETNKPIYATSIQVQVQDPSFELTSALGNCYLVPSGTDAFDPATSFTCQLPAIGSMGTVSGSYTFLILASDSIGHSAVGPFVYLLVDSVVPSFSALTVTGGYQGQRFSTVSDYVDGLGIHHDFHTVNVAFSANKPVDAANAPISSLSQFSVTAGGQPLTCTFSAPANYNCVYSVTGNETDSSGQLISSESQGVVLILAQATDEAGNQAVPQSASITLDFSAPSLPGAATVGYVAGSPSLLPQLGITPTAATVGTDIRVSFTTSESLIASPSVSSVPSGIAFAQTSPTNNSQGNPTSTSFVLDGSFSALAGLSDGPAVLTVSIADLVGNMASATTTAAIKTSTPAAPNTNTSNNVVYTRAPWGDATSGGVAYFALSMTASAAPSADYLVAYNGPSTNATQLGLYGPNAGAGFATMSLVRQDNASVYVAVLDGAGNTSPIVPVLDTTWIGTFGSKIPGSSLENPNTLLKSQDFIVSNAGAVGAPSAGQYFEGPIAQLTGFASEPLSYAQYQLPNAMPVVSTSAAAPWQQVTAVGGPIDFYPSSVYDSARGVTVLIGVNSSSTDETWEWNGYSWSNVTPIGVSPPVRFGQATTYDAARGVTVMFGGIGFAANGITEAALNDTWVWDGSTWTQKNPAHSPPARWGMPMAYDAQAGLSVLFGGCDGEADNGCTGYGLKDTWIWDGTDWSEVTPSGGAPGVRWEQSMVYDAGNQVVLMAGGNSEHQLPSAAGGPLAETWALSWNGSSWTWTAKAAMPFALFYGAMSYDYWRGKTTYTTGCSATASGTGLDCVSTTSETYSWNGLAWSNLSPGGPAVTPASGGAMSFDQVRGVAMVYNIFGNDQLLWDGTSYTPVTVFSAAPTGISSGNVTYDSTDKVTLFDACSTGSNTEDMQEWSGASWAAYLNGGSPFVACDGNGMVYDPALGVTLYVDNQENFFEWTQSTGTWVQKAVSPNPQADTSAPEIFAYYDPGWGRAAVWDGAKFWEWLPASTQWTQATPAAIPEPIRGSSAMSFDSSRDLMYLFGGSYADTFGNNHAINDTWSFNRSTFTWTELSPATSPAARATSIMAFDSTRNVSVLYGGEYPNPSTGANLSLNDTWEWNGTTWTQIPRGNIGPPAGLPQVMTYDPVRQTTLLISQSIFSQTDDLWIYPTNQQQRAADIAEFAFGTAEAQGYTITGMTFTGYGGGTGNSGTSGGQLGAALAAWDAYSGEWKILATTSTAAAATPAQMTYTATAAEAPRYLLAANQTIHLAVLSSYARSLGEAMPVVSAGYIQVSVSYRQTEQTTSSTCASSESLCGGNLCVNLQTDAANCGACGNACPYGVACSGGECLCGGVPTNTLTDKNNCGTCGNVCPAGISCSNGVCACGSNETACGSVCVDLFTDVNNCGGCGPSTACSSGDVCCSGTCSDRATDVDNCGACGNVCSGSVAACCSSTCTSLLTDNNNCGGCGSVCSGGQTCVSGVCQCAAGLTYCNNNCVNTTFDANDCGTCGNVCSSHGSCGALPWHWICSSSTCSCFF